MDRSIAGKQPMHGATTAAFGFDGAYHRFAGKVTIDSGVRVERFEGRAVWELMYLRREAASNP
jgi:hypothetical protein